MKQPFNVALHRAVTLIIVQIGWVVFRAPKLPEGFKILKTMYNPFSKPFAFNAEGFIANPLYLVFAVAGIIYCIVVERKLDLRSIETIASPSDAQRVVALFMLFISVLVLFSAPTVPFIYFQF